jgi:hypothetical protein
MNLNSLQVLKSIAEASKNAPIRQSRDSPAMSYWIVDMDKRDVAPNATHLVPGVMCSL